MVVNLSDGFSFFSFLLYTEGFPVLEVAEELEIKIQSGLATVQ